MCEGWKVTFDWSTNCLELERDFIDSYSKAIGCPEEYFYFPFLSHLAACMGLSAKLKINITWMEPAVLWTVVASRRGKKKSAAASIVLNGIQKLEKKLASNTKEEVTDDGKADDPKHLYVNIFSFERLYKLMAKNDSQILGFFDEFSLLYDLIANNKGGKSQLD